MDDIQDTISKLKRNTHMEVGSDFESNVFSKIKRKKKQRKITASVTLSLAVCGFIYLAQATLIKGPASKPLQNTALNTGANAEKEMEPVSDDVVFATSDDRSSYVIEQVGYQKDDGSF